MFITLFVFIMFSIVCMLFSKGFILAAKSTQTISKKALAYSLLACVVCMWHLGGAILFFITYFGGLARWGWIEAGKYYLGYGSHLTEVSPNTYWLCYYYVAVAEVIVGTAIIAAGVCYCWNRFKKGSAADEKVIKESSGRPLEEESFLSF